MRTQGPGSDYDVLDIVIEGWEKYLQVGARIGGLHTFIEHINCRLSMRDFCLCEMFGKKLQSRIDEGRKEALNCAQESSSLKPGANQSNPKLIGLVDAQLIMN